MTGPAVVVSTASPGVIPAPRRSMGSESVPARSPLRKSEEAAMKQQPPVGHLAARDSASTLSDRDLQVLECLASGHSTAQIAAVLSVSSNTARTKIRRIQGKL